MTTLPTLWWYDEGEAPAALQGLPIILQGSGRSLPRTACRIVACAYSDVQELSAVLGRHSLLLVRSVQGRTLPSRAWALPDEPASWPAFFALLSQYLVEKQEGAQLQARLESAEHQLREQQDEWGRLEAQASISLLVRSLAHEINNPLAVILGNAELIVYAAGTDQRLARRAQTIVREVSACQTFIERLRRFAQPQGEAAGKQKLDTVVAQALERLSRRGMNLPTIQIIGRPPLLYCGHAAITRVIEQVIDNALRAGAQKISIEAKVIADQHCQIHIENDGLTPSAEEMQRAIVPFFSERGRSGLGLSLAKSLLGEYSGTIELRAGSAGEGACVDISLPLWREIDRIDEAAGGSRASSDEQKAPLSSAKMLIVDDDALVAELILLAAEEQGWSARVATSLSQARDLIRDWSPHAIIVDVHVGGEDGLDLVRSLAQGASSLSQHMIIMSGDIEHPSVNTVAQKTGARRLGKPFRRKDLVKLLEEEFLAIKQSQSSS